MTTVEWEKIVPPFARETITEGRCQYQYEDLGGITFCCDIKAVFVVMFRFDEKPILCCVHHLPEAVEFKHHQMPGPTSEWDAGMVMVGFINENDRDSRTNFLGIPI